MTPTWAELHAAGMTARQAAEARGVAVDGARKWAKRAGVRWQPAPVGKQGVPSMAECHAAGMTAQQAAVARGTARATAYEWARKHGVTWPTIGPHTARPRKPDPAPVRSAKRPRMTEAEARATIRRMTPDERLAWLMAADAKQANARMAKQAKGRAV